jgi:hypothetical protein
MAARTVKIRHDEETRTKIKTSQLINRLSDHAFGNVVLEATQIKAIEILLRKTLPDLNAVTIDGNVEINDLNGLTNAELRERVALLAASLGVDIPDIASSGSEPEPGETTH